ncbi:MAG TPA: DUF547 domain-containing protein [Geminicoccaceae bacterium]|nr:DUF547 domain-containing protein [Geminicoccaceae bacterium]
MMRARSWLIGPIAVLIAALAMSTEATPRAKLWDRWTAHDPAASAAIGHDAWAAFLGRYVSVATEDGVARVAYCDVDPADRAALDAYLADLAATRISAYNRDEQMAYWINLYNALTVRLVLDHYPVRSVRDIDISPGPFSDGPWGKQLIEVEGEPLSLDDIQNRILRPIWRDPRVHYALSCAAVGCPDLGAEPYRGSTLDAQLTRAARAYVNHPRGVAIQGGRLVVSKIYTWFQEDFGGSAKGVLRHLKAYAEPGLAMRLERFDDIDDDRYDWTLNRAEGC